MIESLFVISILKMIFVLFVSFLSSKYSILLDPMNIVLSIFDKEQDLIGICRDDDILISVYDKKEVNLPSERLILPKKES